MNLEANLTFISDEVSQDLDTVIDFTRRNHLLGFELRSMFGRAFKDLTSQDISRISERTLGEGLKVYGCATPVFKCDLNDACALRLHRDLFRQALASAHSLGCRMIRIFTFNRPLIPREGAEIERAAAEIAPLLEEGRRAGVTVAVENECSCTVASAREVQALLAELPPGRVPIIWDPCNALYLPEYSGSSDLDPTSFAPAIVHVHVKDASRAAANSSQPAIAQIVGTGEVGWGRHLSSLFALGYRGLYSLETHWRRRALCAEALHLPAGHAFSAGGEEASEICLGRLRSLLEQATMFQGPTRAVPTVSDS